MTTRERTAMHRALDTAERATADVCAHCRATVLNIIDDLRQELRDCDCELLPDYE